MSLLRNMITLNETCFSLSLIYQLSIHKTNKTK